MPNRQIVNGEPYRYAYQGQEKDLETGKEAFQLRLWDARIGRWLTTDPYGQFSSPYMAMHNNPINAVDSDGGFTDYVWTDANGKEHSRHVNDGRNQVVRIDGSLGFLAIGLSNSGVSDPTNAKLDNALMSLGTKISNTSTSFNKSDLSSAWSYIKHNNSIYDYRTKTGDNCLTQVCRATSKIYSGEKLNLWKAKDIHLPGNVEGKNNMNKTMQHLINIDKAVGNQITQKGTINISQTLTDRTVRGAISVWGVSLNNSYHSVNVFVDRTGIKTKFIFTDLFGFRTLSTESGFNKYLNKVSDYLSTFSGGNVKVHNFTQYQH